MAVRAVAVLLLAAGVASNVHHRQQPALMTDLRRGLSQQDKPIIMVKAPIADDVKQRIELESISESKSYGDRVKDASIGFVIGLVLFFGSFIFLFFVEMETCKAFVLINRARKACRTEIAVNKVQKKYENCMVYVSGYMTTESGQIDDELGLTPADKCVVLKRTVEVYQWVEHKEERDKKTTYHYNTYWREDDVESASFKYAMGHSNPPRQHKFYSKKILNKSVQLGVLELKSNVLEKLENFTPLDNLSTNHRGFSVADKLGDEAGTRGNRRGTWGGGTGFSDVIKAAADPDSMTQKLSGRTYSISGQGQHLITGDKDEMGLYTKPQVGDMRISYQVIKEGPVSIAGVQTENTFRRFLMQRDGTARGHDQINMYELVADEEPPPEPTGCVCTDVILRYVGMAFPHSILLVNAGIVDKETMFSAATAKLAKTQHVMRFIGFVLMWLGLYLILKPIADILSFIPFVSNILKSFFWVVSLLVTLVLSSITIALAWVWFHPEVLSGILAAVGGLLWAHGTSRLAEYLPDYTHPCTDVEKCGVAIEVGRTLMFAACFPLAYFLHLQYQEWQYSRVLIAEMEAREKDDLDLV